ncbi:post-GPI attachment to proteins factor 2-like [Stomoxys calcitrans]|uniref:CWH43-like N-terminal domain-containing protein n=1 Tax=Stomoxys calcitrans TaxID=35570 RepID=A0A1I8QEN4_STOCA|nr:post-GPI attachment to proteins factor 2-like [Stomoxys calcitrans]
MLPTYERLNGPKVLFKIAFSKIAISAISLALGAFLFCIFWSVVFDFERSTFTHCDVRNYLPSISAAIGNYEPQKSIWRISIILHLPARLAVAHIYYNYYKEHIRKNRRIFAQIAVALNVIENFALLSLSVWTSSDSYDIHRNAFVAFIASSELYMIISYFLNKNGRKQALTETEEKSVRYKLSCFLINLLAFALAGYFFVRHNSKCEPGVYTLFALFEYVVVFSNMSYHMTSYWDFYGYFVHFDKENGMYLSHL